MANNRIEDMKRQREIDDKEIKTLNDAESLDILSRIKVCEGILTKQTNWNSDSWRIKLAQLYVESGQNQKAWAFLNKIYAEARDIQSFQFLAPRVRKIQFEILRDEGKYLDAIEAYMMSTLMFSNMLRSTFIRTTKPLIRKSGIKLDPEVLADMVDSAINQKQDENVLSNQFRSYLSSVR